MFSIFELTCQYYSILLNNPLFIMGLTVWKYQTKTNKAHEGKGSAL